MITLHFNQPTDEGWSPGDWIGLGTLLVGFVTTVSGIVFAWRADRRAARELEKRVAKLEKQLKQK